MTGITWLVVILPVINEVMANPAGVESCAGSPGDRNEFVEIYNPSDVPVDMSVYLLADRMESDEIVPFPDSTILNLYPGAVISTVIPPGGYGVILDREYMTEGNGQYLQPYQIPAGAVLMSTGDTDIGGNGLSNTDSLWLIDGRTNNVVDVYPAPIVPPDGVSVERRSPDENVWMLSREGCTPGRRNSVSIRMDIAVIPNMFTVDPSFPFPGDEITATLAVFNAGIDDIQRFDVVVIRGDETFFVHHDSILESNDTAWVSFGLGQQEEGMDTVIAIVRCDGDEVPANDTGRFAFVVGISPLVLNEFDYSSDPEWVELFNRGAVPFSLSGSYLEDRSGHVSEPLPDSLTVAPGGYIVVAADSTFGMLYPGVDFIVLDDFPSLNNSGDDIMLKLPDGVMIDSVRYSPSWGGKNGHSLERVSVEVPGWERYNWAESGDPSGATPGRRNSVARSSTLPAGVRVAIRNRIVRPDRGENLIIDYRYAEPLKRVTVIIFDEIGQEYKRDVRTSLSREGELMVDVSNLPQGLYIAYITAETVTGGAFRDKKTFSVENRP